MQRFKGEYEGRDDPREPCPECDGEGSVDVVRHYGADPADTRRARCDDCEGSTVVACDHCGNDALKAYTTRPGDSTFYYCSAKCRLDDLGPLDEEES